jgi:heterodisulfide reductase subunit A
MNKKALVIGGGIAGIQASIDLAERGIEVYLVEKGPSIGGRMAQLDKTFPTNDCAMCILAPKMMECFEHDNIDILTYSEVISVEGDVGNFKVKIRKKASYVTDKCTGCSECEEVCPVEVAAEFDEGLRKRKAIYRPFPQAVPNVYTISRLGTPACEASCPIHQNAHGYLALIPQRKYKEALDVILRDNPLPAVCGRVCVHPCEEACKRKEVDEPVAIAALKRFVVDQVDDYELSPPSQERRERVAIVGSGRAGLACAYDLRRKGYQVTVYEALPVAGGMLAVGIPQHRLPKEILNKEIKKLEEIGIRIKLNTPVGKEITLQDLKEKYDAVFVAIGAHLERRLGIPGEDLGGVMSGIDFLRKVNLKEEVELGGRVIVVGGGNSALDAARTAKRVGADEVTIIYRRSRKEMPAFRQEVEEALNESIKIEFLTNPIRILGGNKVKGVECIRMELGEPDESGRRRPIPIEGSQFHLPCDNLIISIGQMPDGAKLNLERTRWGGIVVDETTLQTNVEGVFAGGDCVRGPDIIVNAMSDGRRAAESIHRYLSGLDLRERHKLKEEVKKVDITGVQPAKREEMPRLPTDQREGFAEVNLGLSEEQALREAKRCLHCSLCCDCRLCEGVCEPKAIDYSMRDKIIEVEVGAIIVATGFNYYSLDSLEEYGYKTFKNVITAMEFERLLSASGPTEGHIRRPSDSKTPKKLAFIQCVGSRDFRCRPYCSSVCCMHSTKQAILANEHHPGLSSYIFYTDLRAVGKGFWDYIRRAEREYNVTYIRSKPGSIIENPNKNLIVWYEDMTEGEVKGLEVELVVLAGALIPSSAELSEVVGISLDEYGFFEVADKLKRPVDTKREGVFVCGFCQAPQDIPDSIIQASAAACRVAEVLVSIGNRRGRG